MRHGVTAAERADEYLDYLNETGSPDCRKTEGNRGVYVLCRIKGDWAHFLTVSFWGSIEEVKNFARPDPEKARYYPEDESFLLEFEPQVKQHYDVVVEP
jgi:heme-degrading monooxygenase HmoA